jgi:hypothetical protein
LRAACERLDPGARANSGFRAACWIGGGVAAGHLSHGEAAAGLIGALELLGMPTREARTHVERGLALGAREPWAERDRPEEPRAPRVRRELPPPEARIIALSRMEAPVYESAQQLCARKGLEWETLRTLGVEVVSRFDRPALRWRVRTVLGAYVYRWRILTAPKASFAWSADPDGEQPIGAVDAVYGVPRRASDAPHCPLIVNGESSVWACAQHGLRAVTMTLGEGAVSEAAVRYIVERAAHDCGDGYTCRRVCIAYDLDEVGTKGALAVADAVEAAGGEPRIVTLPADLGRGGDVCDILALGRRDELINLMET